MFYQSLLKSDRQISDSSQVVQYTIFTSHIVQQNSEVFISEFSILSAVQKGKLEAGKHRSLIKVPQSLIEMPQKKLLGFHLRVFIARYSAKMENSQWKTLEKYSLRFPRVPRTPSFQPDFHNIVKNENTRLRYGGGPHMTSENRILYFSQLGCIISLSVTNQNALFLQQQQQFQTSENRTLGENDFQIFWGSLN